MSRLRLDSLRYPRRFATWALERGTLGTAFACIAIAMGFSTLAAYRLAATVNVDDLIFGSGRIDQINTLIRVIGVDRTTVLVYMVQRSFDALVVASALTPVFLWVLGSSAMHAAARLLGVRGHAYLPILVLFAYAELVYQVPASTASLVLGGAGGGVGPQIASVISLVMLVWFAAVAYQGVKIHYGVSGSRARAIFVLGAVVFYLVPLLLIVSALVAIVLAAALLEYF